MKYLKKAFVGVVLNAFALYFLTMTFPDAIHYTGGISFFILAGIVIGILNTFIRPVVTLLSLPFIFLTGGILMVFINAGVFWFLEYFLAVAQFRDVTLSFSGAQMYVIAAVAFGVINWAQHLIINNE